MANGSDSLTTTDLDDYVKLGTTEGWLKKTVSGTVEYSVPWQEVTSTIPSYTYTGGVQNSTNTTWGPQQYAYLGQFTGSYQAQTSTSPEITVDDRGLTFKATNFNATLANLKNYGIPVHDGGATTSGTGGMRGVTWYEGIFTIVSGATDTLFNFFYHEDPLVDTSTTPRGGQGNLWLNYTNGVGWTFVYRLYDFNNGTRAKQISDGLPTGVPLYYRIVRCQDSSITGDIDVFITDGSTTYTDQTYTFTDMDNPGHNNEEPLWFGGFHTDTTSNGEITHHWVQARWSDDTGQTASFGFGNHLTNPKLRPDTTVMVPNTLTTVIEGDNTGSQYVSQTFSGTDIPGGTSIGLLHHARNDNTTAIQTTLASDTAQNLPAGTTSIAHTTVETGLYLYSGFQMSCGGNMNLLTPKIKDDGNGVITTVYFEDTPPPAPTITISLGGEGAAEAQLPFMPDYPATESTEYQFVEHAYEYPYTHIHGKTTGSRTTWELKWTLDQADAETLIAFFDARRGGEGAFTFYTPDDQTNLQKAALVGDITATQLAGEQAYEVKATVREVK